MDLLAITNHFYMHNVLVFLFVSIVNCYFTRVQLSPVSLILKTYTSTIDNSTMVNPSPLDLSLRKFNYLSFFINHSLHYPQSPPSSTTNPLHSFTSTLSLSLFHSLILNTATIKNPTTTIPHPNPMLALPLHNTTHYPSSSNPTQQQSLSHCHTIPHTTTPIA